MVECYFIPSSPDAYLQASRDRINIWGRHHQLPVGDRGILSLKGLHAIVPNASNRTELVNHTYVNSHCCDIVERMRKTKQQMKITDMCRSWNQNKKKTLKIKQWWGHFSFHSLSPSIYIFDSWQSAAKEIIWDMILKQIKFSWKPPLQ
jgi:hypothetical protein